MKTNTYLQFKNWVKTTCINKVTSESHIYEGDTAHAIYTAWYIFKHNFSEQQVDEYIQKDIEQSHKTFYNHGFCVSLDNYYLDKIPEENRILIKLTDASWNPYYACEGGGYYFDKEYLHKDWAKTVKTILKYWTIKLIEETENGAD